MLKMPGEPWRRDAVEDDFGAGSKGIFMGFWEGTPCYAVEVDHHHVDPMRHVTGNLFSLLGRVPDPVFHAYGRAVQLLSWERDHRFCGRCGQPTQPADSGRALGCPSCRLDCYPRLSPCVIFGITKGDSLLLAAAQNRRLNFYSTLAGFIEPGETAEQAVAREAMEEVGLEVENVRYFGSQAWPFPGQLMLGFYADYKGGEIQVDPEEIEEAYFFTREALPPIPPPASIAGQLIHNFFGR